MPPSLTHMIACRSCIFTMPAIECGQLWSSFDHLRSPYISLVRIELFASMWTGQYHQNVVLTHILHYVTSHHHTSSPYLPTAGTAPPFNTTHPYCTHYNQPEWCSSTSCAYSTLPTDCWLIIGSSMHASPMDCQSWNRQLCDHQKDDPIRFSVLAGPSSNGGQPTLTHHHLHWSLPHPTYFTCDLRVPTHHCLAKKKGSSRMQMYCLECSLEMGWVLWREQHRGRRWGYMVVKKVVTGEGEWGRVPSQIPNPAVHYAIMFSLLNSSQAEPGSRIPNPTVRYAIILSLLNSSHPIL